MLGLAACTMPERPPEAAGIGISTVVSDEPRWHYLRFQWAPLDDGTVATYLDLVVAAEIVAPLIQTAGSEMRLWRFHRRWPADEVGHLFSWIVYAPPETVADLAHLLRAHPLTQRLADQGRLKAFRVDVLPGSEGTAVGATSDPSWPAEIRDAWPEYIQGASRLWLGLVRAAAADAPGDLDTRYQAAEAEVERLWFEQADHAMLHHLNALFGYRPLRVRGHGIMRF